MPHGDSIAQFDVSGTPQNVLHTWDPTKPVSGINDLDGFAARYGFNLTDAIGPISFAHPFDANSLRQIMNLTVFGLAADLAGKYIPTVQDIWDAQYVCAVRGTAIGGYYPGAESLWDWLVFNMTNLVYTPNDPPTSIADTIYLFPGTAMRRTAHKTYYLPGVTNARDIQYGFFNPAATPPFNPFWSRTEMQDNFIKRYGHGFGSPVQQDLTVLPAISYIPDADHNNFAWLLEENFIPPTPGVLTHLGLPPGYTLNGWDLADLKACNDFELYLISLIPSYP